MAEKKFRKYTKDERKRLGLDDMPETMYEVDRDLKRHAAEELPISFGEDVEDDE